VKGLFQGLHARILCHATEDPEKVKLALSTAIESEDISVSKTEGHHGNPIQVLEAHIDDEAAIRRFFERMDSDDLAEIVRTLESRMDDKCAVFIRLDKQSALTGTIKLGRNEDVISMRLRVRAYPSKFSVASAIVTEFIEGLMEDRVA
jgi:RNA binding exosome subunit